MFPMSSACSFGAREGLWTQERVRTGRGGEQSGRPAERVLTGGGGGTPGAWTHGVHGRSDVQVDPDPGPVEADVRGDEKAGAGAGAVVPVLGQEDGRDPSAPAPPHRPQRARGGQQTVTPRAVPVATGSAFTPGEGAPEAEPESGASWGVPCPALLLLLGVALTPLRPAPHLPPLSSSCLPRPR